MSSALRNLPVLVLDCQASGVTPAHGDLLEIGWAMCSATGGLGPLHECAVVPRTRRPVSRAVRELTGWSEARVALALPEQQVWSALCDTLAGSSVPTLIHFARFELRFLADLHARLAGDTPFPFDARCLHAIAARLFPDLPRLIALLAGV
jgi:hypothetical protein